MHKWSRGHIGRFWDLNSFKEFQYTKQPVTQEEIDEWLANGYDHVKSFTGSMYDSRNPMPEWVNNFGAIFGHEYINLTYTFYRMSTLEIMPTHVDHYRTYRKIFSAEYKNVRRILVMLEDWKPGHYLEINGTGIVNWVAGDYFMWEGDCPHAASNIGIDDRYTLQITCEQVDNTPVWDADRIWKNIHWYNVPDLRTIKESTSPMMSRVIEACDNHNGDPWMVYMYNEKIASLEQITHTPETVAHLNEKGLQIYLYEPLCSYKVGATQLYPPTGTKHTRWFYSEFDDIDPQDLRSDELDSIREYVIKNKLTNVTVRTCDYDAHKYYPYYAEHMNVVTDDMFLKTIFPITLRKPELAKHFTKRFICLNWRYTPHRHLIASYVANKNSLTGWYFKGDVFTIHKNVWYNIYEWENKNPTAFQGVLQGLSYINTHAPLNVDLDIEDAVLITDPYFMDYWPKSKTLTSGVTPSNTNPETNVLEKFYNDVFCDIVNETRFAQPTGNYSEKTYQAMYYLKPFVLCAPPHTLKYLKEQGFKTFSDFWDESYDECENHEQRLFKIFEVIDFINGKSMNELREMYAKMSDILEHNKELLNKKVIPV
jgi:hypothetical protein